MKIIMSRYLFLTSNSRWLRNILWAGEFWSDGYYWGTVGDKTSTEDRLAVYPQPALAHNLFGIEDATYKMPRPSRAGSFTLLRLLQVNIFELSRAKQMFSHFFHAK